MDAEAYMKAELDGWFYTFDWDCGMVRACKVPVDYKPKYIGQQTSSEPHVSQHRWTALEDDTVITLRNAGKTWRVISKAIGLSTCTVSKRYVVLCAERGIEPLSAAALQARKYSLETEARVVSLRKNGANFRDIGRVTGLTRDQANQLYLRWVDKQRAKENRGEKGRETFGAMR